MTGYSRDVGVAPTVGRCYRGSDAHVATNENLLIYPGLPQSS